MSSIPLANISIPSNLQEILASLKNVGPSTTGSQNTNNVERMQVDDDDDDEEYNPLPITASKSPTTTTYKPRPTSPSTRAFLLAQEQNAEEIPFLGSSSTTEDLGSGPSKLSHMTEAELMRLVPDGVDLAPPPQSQVHAKVIDPDMPPGLGDGNDEEYDPGQ